MLYVYLVLSVMLIAAGGWGAAGDWPRLGMTMLFLGLGSGAAAVRHWQQQRGHRLALEGVGEDEAELLAESYQKALADYRFLQAAQAKLGDRELRRELGRMQHIAKNMLAYLEQHPRKLPMAQRFIDYYQDRAVALVQKYQELEATELTTEKVSELKARMKATLAGLDDAYAEQFERLLSDQMITADAELTVMEQQLGERGIRLDKAGSPERALGRAEEKQADALSMDGLMESLERDGLPARRAGGSLVPEEERPAVIRHKAILSALAIFLGTLGAHKFYQGKSFTGILYFLFAWTSLPTWISLVEGVRYLFMPVDDFYVQYHRNDD